jgi:DNA mismatch repair protein MutH
MSNSPNTLSALLTRAQQLAGCTLADIAAQQAWPLPKKLENAKGWIGQLIENFLGATAGSSPTPDFPHLGVELKTIPIDPNGKPCESTYVCTVPLIGEPGQQWENSVVWQKLQRVLWIPIQGQTDIPLKSRRVGIPILWEPTPKEREILKQDWEELMTLVSLGQVQTISAKLGTYLQIRPKAANHRILTQSTDPEGKPTSTLPRGFYLRPQFTKEIIKTALLSTSTP